MKKILLTLLVLFTVFTCVGCHDNSSKTQGGGSADLKITYFNGGYGEKWINNLAARFEAATGHKVEVVPSATGSLDAENYIKSGYNLSDIYFGENIPWKSLVQGSTTYLADLSDVYESEVQTRNGMVKIKDFIDGQAVGYYYSQKKLSDQGYNPWVMPWTVQPNAMAYNVDALTQIPHLTESGTLEVEASVSNGKWVDVPKTYADLLVFCKDTIAWNDTLEHPANPKYVPFGFAGSINADSVSFMILPWWAEGQGLDEEKFEGEGNFYDFFNYGNTATGNVGQTVNFNVFKQTGLSNAYGMLRDLIVDKDDPSNRETQGYNKNCLTKPYNNNSQQEQELFVAKLVGEKPVLTIASSYLENEVTKNRFIDSDGDGQNDIHFKFMNVPKISASSEEILYCRLSDSAVVPARAPHLAVAKEFLKFMCSEEEIINFSIETSGGIRPFKCDVRTRVDGTPIEYTEFASSLFEVYYSSRRFYEYPYNTVEGASGPYAPEALAKVSNIFRYQDPTFHGNVSWADILSFLKTSSTPGETISLAVIERLRQNELEGWKNTYRITDVTR